jgi:hypothetical protein
MKRTVIMRDRDLIKFLDQERENPLFTDIEVEPLTYRALEEEILIERIRNPDSVDHPEIRTLPNLIETLMWASKQIYDQRYFDWNLTYDYPDGQIYVQSRIRYPRETLNRVYVTYAHKENI